MTTQRKKPIKIEINGGILSSVADDAVAVRIRGSSEDPPAKPESNQAPPQLRGSVKIRREVKGRAGKPVSVLYGFDDPAAKQSTALKLLQARLKEILACGGTFDEETGEIILQVDDLQRVRQTLLKLGFTVKG